MPFTFPSHAAAVLPLCRVAGRLPPSALIVGSCAPDISYLLATSTNFHVWPGFLWPCVPLAMSTWLLGETVLWPSLSRSLPVVRGVELGRFFATRGVPNTWRGWATALAALLLGIATHIIWDGFTHAHQFPARVLYGWQVAEVLQLGSSVFGALLVFMAARRVYPSLSKPLTRSRLRLELIVIGTVIGGALLIARPRVVLWHVFWYLARGAAVGLIAAAAVETIVTRAEAR